MLNKNKKLGPNRHIKGFKYLKDIAIADIAIEAHGYTLEEAFENVMKGVMNIIAEISQINKEIEIDVQLNSKDLSSLLFDFVGDMIFHMDFDYLIFGDVKVIEIQKLSNSYVLKAKLYGQKMSNDTPVKGEVKGPTYHEMVIKQNGPAKYYIRLVVDV